MTFFAQRQAGKNRNNARGPHTRAARLFPSLRIIPAILVVIAACLVILIRNDFIFSEIDGASYVAIGGGIIFVIWLVSHDMQRSTTQSHVSEHDAGDVQGVLEQRISERAVELMTSEAVRAAESERLVQFGQLSQGLFHDLMSPLSAITLYLERLPASDKTAEAQEMVTKVVAASGHMRSFMDSVKRCLGDTHARAEQANLKKEILIVRDILAYKARLANVELRIGKIEPTMLPVHPMRLHQLLINLAANAIEACIGRDDRRESFVDISVTNTASHTLISVSDNGCGIAPDLLKIVFEYPHTTKIGGTGIGLMTVKSVVENDLHGTISVESRQGVGTTFTVKIPRVTKPADQAA